jgi:hypothetical protein
MKATWIILLCALMLCAGAVAQNVAQNNDNGSPNDQNRPVLTPRPQESNPTPPQPNTPVQGSYSQNQTYAPPDVVPEGTRFIVKLKNTLDTKKMDQGEHFRAELREDLLTPSGLIIPKGRTIKGHVGSFERGFTGSRIILAIDEIETRHGSIPLVATVTGVPGDPSIKSTENEGEITRKGPDKKRLIENAAIGAGVGAVSGAAAGGGKGAAVGAVAGAGLGGGAGLLFQGNDLRLEKDTQLELRLDRDLRVPTK